MIVGRYPLNKKKKITFFIQRAHVINILCFSF